MRTLLITALLLGSLSSAWANSDHRHRDYHHNWRERHERYYDGPWSDYSTRFYGENSGTVHYGY